MLADYQAPNTMRISGVRDSTVMVGDAAYAVINGSWARIDPEEGIFIRDLVLTPRIMVKWARLTSPVFVREVRTATGPARIFRYASYDNRNELYTTAWIGTRDHLPRFAIFDTFDSHTSIEYSAFNAVAPFALPPIG